MAATTKDKWPYGEQDDTEVESEAYSCDTETSVAPKVFPFAVPLRPTVLRPHLYCHEFGCTLRISVTIGRGLHCAKHARKSSASYIARIRRTPRTHTQYSVCQYNPSCMRKPAAYGVCRTHRDFYRMCIARLDAS